MVLRGLSRLRVKHETAHSYPWGLLGSFIRELGCQAVGRCPQAAGVPASMLVGVKAQYVPAGCKLDLPVIGREFHIRCLPNCDEIVSSRWHIF